MAKIQEQIQWRKHRRCPVHVERGNWGPHHSRLMCSKHGKMICWLNRQSADLVEQWLLEEEKETGLYNTCNTKKTKNTIKSSASHVSAR